MVAAGCYSVILLSPTGRLFIGANPPQPYVANAWIVAPLGAMFFASASAWYKRFLNLANPNRGKPAAEACGEGPRQRAPELARDRPLLAHPAHARLPDLAHAGR